MNFIANTAAVVGDVTLGENTSIWYSAVLRGDEGAIKIGNGSNIQDNCTVHGEVTVGNNVTVGHNAILHGCTVEDGALIGMGACVLDGAVIGAESLIGAGALDCFGRPRSQMLAVLESALSHATGLAHRNLAGQIDLFSQMGAETGEVSALDLNYPDLKEFSQSDLLAMEKEACGIYLSAHPLSAYETLAKSVGAVRICDLEELSSDRDLTLCAAVHSVRVRRTKAGQNRAEMTLEDLTGSVKTLVFPKVFSAAASKLEKDAVLVVRGRLEEAEGEDTENRAFLVREIYTPNEAASPSFVRRDAREQAKKPASPKTASAPPPGDAPAPKTKKLYLRFLQKEGTIENRVIALLSIFGGETPVFFYYKDTGKLCRANNCECSPTPLVLEQLRQILGEENVQLVEK